ncbi:MAG TPA: hypothetical protein VFF11_08020 [Candidatus Binatia bacterium]|nr:hypothetical protein [Candidatus Binatia bacterium]
MLQESRKLAFDWMNNNPHRWAGKKVQCRRTGIIYTIREVLNARNVVLEKKWVLSMSSVQEIRQDYEPAGP